MDHRGPQTLKMEAYRYHTGTKGTKKIRRGTVDHQSQICEEQDLDLGPEPRQGEKSDGDPHRNEKKDPEPHRSYADPQQDYFVSFRSPVSNLFLHLGFRRGGTSDAQGWIRFHALQGGEVGSAGLQVWFE